MTDNQKAIAFLDKTGTVANEIRNSVYVTLSNDLRVEISEAEIVYLSQRWDEYAEKYQTEA